MEVLAAFAGETQNELMLSHVSRLRRAVSWSFNDGSDCKASGSILSEALLLVASSNKVLYDDQLSLFG